MEEGVGGQGWAGAYAVALYSAHRILLSHCQFLYCYCCTLYRWPFMVPRSDTIRIASCAICWWMSKGTSPGAPAPPAALAAPGTPA